METNLNQSTYLGAFAVAAVAVLVLLTIVLVQNRKIRDMQQPKFGFLGKPLSVLMIALVLGGGYGLVYYTSRTQPEEVEVSANQEVSIEIIATELNSSTHQYKLNAVPSVDNDQWGSENQTFDIYWTLNTIDGRKTEIESDLSENNPGGLIVNLPEGNNSIKATIFLADRVIEKEIRINVE